MEEDIIEKLAHVFTIAINMLQVEIDENKENCNTFEDVQNLIEDWLTILDNYELNNL